MVGKDACLVVDTGFHNRTANDILRRIRRHSPKRTFVLNTHYHSDHVLGNSVFASRGATIIAHEQVRRRMQSLSRGLLAKYRARDLRLSRLLKDVEVSYPPVTYRDRLRLNLGDDLEADLFHPSGRAHTDGDSVVFVRKDRVVFAGDVLWVGYHPNLEDASIGGQIRALRGIVRLRPQKIVPGHGPVCGLPHVRRFIRYLEEFEKNARKVMKEGVGSEEMFVRVIPSWAGDWKMRWLAEANIRSLVRRSRTETLRE